MKALLLVVIYEYIIGDLLDLINESMIGDPVGFN
jgi:hypothetical protein